MSNEITETREKILLTAGKLFSENGFAGVTHRELAKAAGVNSALINYYFRSKELLYEQVMDYSYKLTQDKYPIPSDEGLEPLAGIIAVVRARLLTVFDEGPAGWFPRLVYHEMHDPTSQKQNIRKRYFQPIRSLLTGFVASYIGSERESISVRTAVFNISSQWIMMNVTRFRGRGLFHGNKLSEREKEEIIDRVIEFIKGGLRHIKEIKSA